MPRDWLDIHRTYCFILDKICLIHFCLTAKKISNKILTSEIKRWKHYRSENFFFCRIFQFWLFLEKLTNTVYLSDTIYLSSAVNLCKLLENFLLVTFQNKHASKCRKHSSYSVGAAPLILRKSSVPLGPFLSCQPIQFLDRLGIHIEQRTNFLSTYTMETKI